VQWARYFEERVETMPSSWIRRLEDERLAEQVAHCYEEMPFYRRKLDGARVRPEQVRKVEDLPRLPFTARDELAEDAMHDPPLGGRACVDLIDVVRLELGSSREGRPVAIAYTEKDAVTSAQVGARTLWAAGARPDDLVLHCAPFGLSSDGLAANAALEQTGATVVSVAAGEAASIIALWGAVRPTGLLATSSYALELDEAARAAGLDVHALGLAKLLVRIEQDRRIEPAQRLLEEVWGARTGAVYGIPEIWCAFAAECDERDGLHFLGHGSVVAELVEPSTGRPTAIASGARGELVFSHLEREATPLLRFRSGDLVSIVDTECLCGRTGFRFRLVGRTAA
jgi:phenylacetate-CoA ligase